MNAFSVVNLVSGCQRRLSASLLIESIRSGCSSFIDPSVNYSTLSSGLVFIKTVHFIYWVNVVNHVSCVSM